MATTIQVGQVYNVDPEKTIISPLEHLKTDRDAWAENPAEAPEDVKAARARMKDSIKDMGVLVPVLGYLDKKSKKIALINGRQRRSIVLELKGEGEAVKLPVLIINEDDEATMLAGQYVTNNHQINDTFAVQAQTYKALKALGKSNEEIGRLVGKHLSWVGRVLRVADSPTLTSAVNRGLMSADTAATTYAVDKNFDKESGKLDEKKVKEQVKADMDKLKESANGAAKTGRGAKLSKNEAKGKSGISKQQLKSILDAGPSIVPQGFLLFTMVLVGKTDLATAISKSKGELDFLKTVDFRTEKQRKADRKAAAATNSKAEKAKAAKATPKDIEDDETIEFE